ncbi:TPA: 30S ribosomal protein S5 [Candidatus Dependentiae bacterium]|nr:MAG: 30S ribosomal protein S5 [candidate division TM6 bacterium GW2011_GWE2_31_21]KKP53110.1 MAG: 30S ribosomal protein S5 [candidate division TM6 bacterium GW2011_GWF2_33_332]HBS47929.1 30S ribosomal protein S5 [Candidatus Dependentiae bacterium]HBZ73467.1 30S ribosomal protein S5 [Candidatus Dependentiae bacterium]
MAEAKKKLPQTTEELVEKVLKVRRVAKVITGGRRFAFSALVVVGNNSGSVGMAQGKSRDVSLAIAKAVKKAKESMIEIPLYKTTVPFGIIGKHGASKVVIRSASKGTGVIAGGAVRAVMEAVGVKDILTKSIGSKNPTNVVKATIDALLKLRAAKKIAYLRGKTVKEMIGVKNDAVEQVK